MQMPVTLSAVDEAAWLRRQVERTIELIVPPPDVSRWFTSSYDNLIDFLQTHGQQQAFQVFVPAPGLSPMIEQGWQCGEFLRSRPQGAHF